MKVYVVMFRDDCHDNVSAVFSDRKKAEAYTIRKAAEDMDFCHIENKYRHCQYSSKGNLLSVYEDDYYCNWWIEEFELDEGV